MFASYRICLRLFLIVTIGLTVSVVIARNESKGTYSCFDDASWAINEQNLSNMMPDQRKVYKDFLDGCRRAANTSYCQSQENWRMQMNMFQPRSMVNYTKTGFYKTRAPEHVWLKIKDFWERNHEKETIEWSDVTIYHNSWDVETFMVSVDNAMLPGGGPTLQAAISDAARGLMEEWTGMRQAASSLYGIRIYKSGAILAPHVDRLPLVSSAIINVAQDVDEPWPLEVYDHEGNAYNITMMPGDMVLYESHSVIHGRPYPLKGRFMANIFIHFEPIESLGTVDSVGNENLSDLPPYLIPGSSWEPEWRALNPKGWQLDPCVLAKRGDISTLRYLASINPSMLDKSDMAGKRPLLYACQYGHLDIIKFLIEHGADTKDSRVSVCLRRKGALPDDGRVVEVPTGDSSNVQSEL